MIRNILFDFDGVILDSMKIKGDGFLELFKEYDEKLVLKLEKFHYENGGISRFEKIRYFYNEILRQEVSEEKVLELANKFSEIIKKKLYSNENLIEETIKFIKENYKRFNLHIVSGSEHNELNKLCNFFGINKYFISINGSPTAKEILVKDIILKYSYKREETILIGDSINDYNAAMKNGIKFYGYNNESLNKVYYINSFKELKF